MFDWIITPKRADHKEVQDQRGEYHDRDDDDREQPALRPLVDLRGIGRENPARYASLLERRAAGGLCFVRDFHAPPS